MLPHLRPCRFHFLVKLPCGHPQNAASEGGQLDQSVGGRHPHGVVPADLVGQRFNVSIGGLALFGVDHLNVVELALFAGVALLLVAVEYHHQTALCEARVAGKPVTQLAAGGVQIILGLRRQVLPREDHVVAVHDDVFLPGRPDGDIVSRGTVGDAVDGAADGAELPLHDLFQLLVVQADVAGDDFGSFFLFQTAF